MNYRNLFIGVDEYVLLSTGNYVIPVNFDNATTTPPLVSVVNEINTNLRYYSGLGRSSGQKALYSTYKFETARNDILHFFHLKSTGDHTVVYVKSTTEGINLLAQVLTQDSNEVILSTRMEHHANDLPWRYYGNKVDYVEINKNGRLPLQALENKLIHYNGRVNYVTVTGASNVTGYVNDIHKIARLCHQYGAKIIIDAAQLVAHHEINMAGNSPEEQIDFLVFSSHKAYAPFGGGAVVGLKKVLDNVDPFLKGGSAVNQVFDYTETWSDAPERLEAGTQNYFGMIALAAALKELKRIGFNTIVHHENQLKDYLIQNMIQMPHIQLYGDNQDTSDKLGIIVFNIYKRNHEEVAENLARYFGVATRNGKFCAHPYVTRLLGVNNTPENRKEQGECGMVRLSLGLYNTMEEAYRFLNILNHLK
ncbi:selenocysteine lyase/cysteine desulfurase [Evansella vedderi]|uniref:Selenocysteine lyase/cysteine desulfurase n=1 Tax=Evansella vedderi TaxID=38282 RepID=A0ABT9ZU99_9BACI|nr:aminotransferase class V-fold PLP-dependent enzyme [Evansella vedderi]MDQ0254821.1 selenocysteine lyase/cysteine desulfurase [Evansella vedderi]